MTKLASLYGKRLVDSYVKIFGLDNITAEQVYKGWLSSVERFKNMATDYDVMQAIKIEIAIRKEGFVNLVG